MKSPIRSKVCRLLLLSVCSALPAGCSTQTIRDRILLSPEQETDLQTFADWHWSKKVSFIRSLARPGDEARAVLLLALQDPVGIVRYEAVIKMTELQTEVPAVNRYAMVTDRELSVRRAGIEYIEKMPLREEDIALISRALSDRDWSVREAALRSLRRYGSERDNRANLSRVKLTLESREPSVLAEAYRTLYWYRDADSFVFAYRRYDSAVSTSEKVVILRELSKFRRKEVRTLLQKEADSSRDPVVRSEARVLLDS